MLDEEISLIPSGAPGVPMSDAAASFIVRLIRLRPRGPARYSPSVTRLYSIENFELLLSRSRAHHTFGVMEGSALAPVIMKTLPSSQWRALNSRKTLPFFMNDGPLLGVTDALSHAVESRSDGVFLGNVPTPLIERLFRKRAIPLVANRSVLQRRFENKIVFHRLLESHSIPVPPGIVLRSREDRLDTVRFPAVLQEPESYGSFGTFFVDTPSEARRIMKRRELRFPLLLRSRVRGDAFGVTLLIDRHGHTLTSALRIQASITGRDATVRKGEGGFYFGVQWVPKSHLSTNDRRNIERHLEAVARVLASQGFNGIANIDLIVGPDGIFFIECNPRLSGATWQLAQHPQLLHDIDFVESYTRVCLGGSVGRNIIKLPPSRFEGATMDLDIFIPFLTTPVHHRRSHLMAGVYTLGATGCHHSLDVRTFRGRDKIFFYPGATAGNVLDPGQGLGVVLSNRPLYHTVKGEMRLSPWGKEVFRFSKKATL